jgi:hypothetical protein
VLGQTENESEKSMIPNRAIEKSGVGKHSIAKRFGLQFDEHPDALFRTK